jgi:hypothetical protein
VGPVEGAHAVDLGPREPVDPREGGLQVFGETVDDRGTPALSPLPFHDALADLPVEGEDFAVDRERGQAKRGEGSGALPDMDILRDDA